MTKLGRPPAGCIAERDQVKREDTNRDVRFLPGHAASQGRAAAACLVCLAAIWCVPDQSRAGPGTESRFLDLSLIVSTEYPCHWPTFPRFQINSEERIGPLSPYFSEALFIDGNTGTQLDVPPHSVTPPESGLSNAGPFGRSFTDVIPAWQFGGEACVIDCRDLRAIRRSRRPEQPRQEESVAIEWEKVAPAPRFWRRRPVAGAATAIAYYRPLPEGRRYAAEPLEGTAPAWPDPDPDCMEFVAGRGVMTLGTDSTSMGPLPDLAEPTHYAGLKHGMIWTESNIGLGALPATGAFYCILSPKFAGGPYGEARAVAVVGDPLAGRLIDSARKKKVVDLSVVLAEDLPVSWPGKGVGNHRQQFMRIRWGHNPNTKAPFESHIMDGNAGTHLVPPSYALPPPGFDSATYSPAVREWLAEFEAKYGACGRSDVTTDRVPIAQGCGPARIIDVKHLLGSKARESWPASPEITAADVERYEKEHGALRAGDVVIFQSRWSDRFYRPLPEGKACMDDPLNGKSEGWPAPGPDAVLYMAGKGVRCVATDAPTLGGVDPKRALMTFWALGGKGMAGVEYLTHVGQMPRQAYFLFAAVKIRGGHGGHGRAIAPY